jgi:hypothetical protein
LKAVPEGFARIIQSEKFPGIFEGAANCLPFVRIADFCVTKGEVIPAIIRSLISNRRTVLRLGSPCDILTKVKDQLTIEDRLLLLSTFVTDILYLVAHLRVFSSIQFLQRLFDEERIDCEFQPVACAAFLKELSGQFREPLSDFVRRMAAKCPSFFSAIVKGIDETTEDTATAWRLRLFALDLYTPDSSLKAPIGYDLEAACEASPDFLREGLASQCLKKFVELLTPENYGSHEEWARLLFKQVMDVQDPSEVMESFVKKMIEVMPAGEAQQMATDLMAVVACGEAAGDEFHAAAAKMNLLIGERPEMLDLVMAFSIPKDVYDTWTTAARELCPFLAFE